MAVSFQSENIDFKLSGPLATKRWIKKIVENEKRSPGDLNFIFMSDDALLARNREFLRHDYYTDIITFDYSQGKTVAGDILISIDRIRDNSERFQVGFEQELRRVIIHGVLHLCGYKDKTTTEKAAMRKAEDRALKLFS